MKARAGAPKPLPPRLAVGAVVLEREADEVYVVLVKRARPPMTGQWSLPGGRVERGERLVEAVAREVREETGLYVKVGPLLEVVEVVTDEFHYVILDYACGRAGGELRAGDDASDVARVRLADLASYGVAAAVVQVVTRAVELADRDPGTMFT